MQRVVRAAFFLWVSVVNLVGLSTMWARMADVFGSEAGTRLFGFLGAGATCGEHQMLSLSLNKCAENSQSSMHYRHLPNPTSGACTT